MTMQQMTPKRRQEWIIYRKAVRHWNKAREAFDGGRCEYTGRRGVHCAKKGSPNPHHRGGREGKLLYYAPWFMKVCTYHHPRAIHIDAVAHSRKMGYIIDKNYREDEKNLELPLPTSHIHPHEEQKLISIHTNSGDDSVCLPAPGRPTAQEKPASVEAN